MSGAPRDGLSVYEQLTFSASKALLLSSDSSPEGGLFSSGISNKLVMNPFDSIFSGTALGLISFLLGF